MAYDGLNLTTVGTMGGLPVDISSTDHDCAPTDSLRNFPRGFSVAVTGVVKVIVQGAPAGWETHVQNACIPGKVYWYTGIKTVLKTGTTATGIQLHL